MADYLKDANYNQKSFYQTRKTMFIDDRIMKNYGAGSYPAVNLYAIIEDKISLSNNSIANGEMKYLNSNGETVCFFGEDDAKEELSMSDGMFKSRKKFLREAGLINYGKQKKKEVGVSIPITYTPWDIWVIQNGLYSDGKWIKEPTSPDFYNPSDIVKVQPNIVPKVEKIEPEPDESLSPDEISEEHKSLLKTGNDLAVQLHKAKQMPLVTTIVERHLGEGKKFKDATVEQMDIMRMICTDFQLALNVS